MKKFHLLILGAIFSGNAHGDTITQVRCYTGGDNPVVSFAGDLFVSELTRNGDGSISITGRKIEVEKEMNAAMPECRDWYLRQLEADVGHRYLIGHRGWNIINVKPTSGTTYMQCALGSTITEYEDSLEYVNRTSGHYVQRREPSRPDFSLGLPYYGGRDSVSSLGCVTHQL